MLHQGCRGAWLSRRWVVPVRNGGERMWAAAWFFRFGRLRSRLSLCKNKKMWCFGQIISIKNVLHREKNIEGRPGARFACGGWLPLRSDAILRAAHVPDGPWWGRMSWRCWRPEWVRRDESRRYVVDFPCGGISSAARNHTVRLPAPKGSNYSITAGKRSAPAERICMKMWAPKGSNTGDDVRSRMLRCAVVPGRPRGRSTPLGPTWWGACLPRARCAYPRL